MISPDSVRKEVVKVAENVSVSQAIRIVENRLYQDLPENNDDMLALCEKMVSKRDWVCFSVGTLWVMRRKTLHELKYLPLFESWLHQYVNGWGRCDAVCGRILNYIVEKNASVFKVLKKWAKSDKPFVRRAAAVSMIRAEQNYIVYYDIKKVLLMAETLMCDEDLYVQKGVGWLLKAASKVYPNDAQLVWFRFSFACR